MPHPALSLPLYGLWALMPSWLRESKPDIARMKVLPASAVRAARIAGRKRLPRALAGVVFLPAEEQHVVTEQDEGVGGGAAAADVTVVVHVVRRDQRHHVAPLQGTLVGQAQVGTAVLMSFRMPPLVGLHPAERGDADPAPVGVG